VKCDICGEELENSDALAKHKERMHAMGEAEEKERELETPGEKEEPETAEPSPMHSAR